MPVTDLPASAASISALAIGLSRVVRYSVCLIATTFGSREQVDGERARVARFHTGVRGEYEAHSVRRAYSAEDADLVEWVHLAFTDAFLTAHERWGGAIPGGLVALRGVQNAAAKAQRGSLIERELRKGFGQALRFLERAVKKMFRKRIQGIQHCCRLLSFELQAF